MEFLKKLPQLLRQHYEKALLGAAMAALLLSGLLLVHYRQKEQDELDTYLKEEGKRKPVLWTNIDWSTYSSSLSKATNVVDIDLTRPRLHNLFGPVKWQRRPDGSLLKIELGNEIGAEALKLAKITPLYLTINLDKTSGGNGFFISVTREGATNKVLRSKFQSYITPGGKDRLNTFVLKEVKGTAEEPELILELTESGERVSLLKTGPFQRIEGYKADLSYPPETKTFTEKRLNESILLGGEEYILVAISQNEVVLSARSNNKRTTLRYNAVP